MKYLVLFLPFFISGCFIFKPPAAPAQSWGLANSWVGGDIVHLTSVFGVPAIETSLPDGGGSSYRWRKERTTVGPPRHEFGPGGKVKVRPGNVSYFYCDILMVAGDDGLIRRVELQGHCPRDLVPPRRNT
ncbi:MAG: hypothetical protein ACRCTY_05485 [Candidatus Adiutrix sp.]